jgi:hypothetical protein
MIGSAVTRILILVGIPWLAHAQVVTSEVTYETNRRITFFTSSPGATDPITGAIIPNVSRILVIPFWGHLDATCTGRWGSVGISPEAALGPYGMQVPKSFSIYAPDPQVVYSITCGNSTTTFIWHITIPPITKRPNYCGGMACLAGPRG